MVINFTIKGAPQPKQRPRVTRNGTYTPAKTINYEKIVALGYKAAGGKQIEGPVHVTVKAYFKIAKSRKDLNEGDWHTQRPDLDNLMKIVKDGLNGVAYKDDSQVVFLDGMKKWSREEKVDVIVWEVNHGGKEILLAKT